MPLSPEHKQQTRERILRSARKLFNRRVFAEVTIDEIMAGAGLTRGGFYKHFSAKEKLYAEAIRQFLCMDRPERWQTKHVDACATGPKLAQMIVNAYLSSEHLADHEGSCPLIGLSSDAARESKAVKTAFRQVVEMMVGIFNASLPEPEARQRALALVALCVGAMVIARAVDDTRLADEFRDSTRRFVLANAGWNEADMS
jgi:AcrR family transcriptional regulator